eukprot:scaffold35419_cov18-Tisochrysis_lutea.AAC.1
MAPHCTAVFAIVLKIERESCIRAAAATYPGGDALCPRAQVVCTLGPKSNTVPVSLPGCAARSHAQHPDHVCNHAGHQGAEANEQNCFNWEKQPPVFLDQLAALHFPAMQCRAGPEIRTGQLKDGKPVQLVTGQEVTITTDYSVQGDNSLIAMRCACNSPTTH